MLKIIATSQSQTFPFVLEKEYIESLKSSMPKLPIQIIKELVENENSRKTFASLFQAELLKYLCLAEELT